MHETDNHAATTSLLIIEQTFTQIQCSTNLKLLTLLTPSIFALDIVSNNSINLVVVFVVVVFVVVIFSCWYMQKWKRGEMRFGTQWQINYILESTYILLNYIFLYQVVLLLYVENDLEPKNITTSYILTYIGTLNIIHTWHVCKFWLVNLFFWRVDSYTFEDVNFMSWCWYVSYIHM